MPETPTTPEARVAIQPGIAWDSHSAYLFDIDGTLLRDPDRVHADSFAASVRQVTGHEVSLAGIDLRGRTDPAILREVFERHAVPDAVLAQHGQAILDAMCSIVAARQNKLRIVLMPGVERVLEHLAGRGAVLGVATGNLERIGWIKLEKAGLRRWFGFGGFSDRFVLRADVVGDGAAQARALAAEGATVCVVGDTPRDIEAARANGLAVIAVATGNYSFDELAAHGPDYCASTLANLLAHTGAGE